MISFGVYMKRMSEVFDLPVDGLCLSYLLADETTSSDDDAIAHAINHVDALADALESVLNTSRGTSGRIIIEIDDEQKLVAALAAYRGEA